MSSSTSPPLFVALMILCGLSAFALPPRYTTPARASVQGLFWPVARPARAIAGAIDRRLRPQRGTDDASPEHPRPADAVYAENHALRAELASLQVKFDQLSRLNADRQLVGKIRSLCKPATVTGSDSSGVRDALSIGGVGAEAAGRPVVHGTDLVGRVEVAGLTGAAVKLVTDPGLAFTVRVARYVPDAAGHLAVQFVGNLHPLARGIGHGAMSIRTLTMTQVNDLHIGTGDLVVLDDTEWPPNVQGFAAGRVSAVYPQAAAPLLADVRVEPVADLSRLTEVMVVVKDGGGGL